MFVVTEAEAAALRAVYEERGELSAAIELRRRFLGITDNVQARACVRSIVDWQPPQPGEQAAETAAVASGAVMTKAELVEELAASNPHLRRADVEMIVTTIFDRITEALARGQKVELRGFGVFGTKPRNARAGRNPRTGEDVPVAAKTVLYFRTGRQMHGRINRGG
jgi:integration host factor subunit beta